MKYAMRAARSLFLKLPYERLVNILIGCSMPLFLFHVGMRNLKRFCTILRHTMRFVKTFIALLVLAASFPATGTISVRDDAGNIINLLHPARRVITLAPHLTELVYAAGAGAQVVGTVSHSDFPVTARKILRIGTSHQIDVEQLIALKPDLVIVWLHGNPARQVEPLQKLGIPLFFSDPRKLEDVPDAIVRLGTLLGVRAHAQQIADGLEVQTTELAERYSNRRSVRTFIQVSDHPLYTLSDRNIVGDVIRLCGGVNVFGGLPVPAPSVSREAVIEQDPEAIISIQALSASPNQVNSWRKYAVVNAVRENNLFIVDADLLSRPGPRILKGAISICEKLDEVRNKRQEK